MDRSPPNAHHGPMSDVFKPVSADGPWWHTAIVGGPSENDHVLALGFHRAAKLLVEHWDAHGANDLLYVPIVYLHRHALELVLKQAIREAAACLRADGAADPDLAAPAIEAKLTSRALGHALGKLADEFVTLLARLNLERLPKETLDVLRSLHRADESGETFRYSTLKQGKGKPPRPARPDQQHIDIVGLANDLAGAFQLLSGGVLTVLDEYHQWQAEMAAEMAQEYASDW